MIIGGAKLYAQTVATADTLYLTEIEAIIEGDAFFPAVDQATWQCTQCIPAKNPTPYAFSFNTYKRKT
jgi:dihydrofolate reductase